MEKGVFVDREVRAAFEKFVVLEVYCDEKDQELREKNQALEQRLVNTVAQPIYLVMRPGDETEISHWGYKRKFVDDPSTFKELLDRAFAQFKAE